MQHFKLGIAHTIYTDKFQVCTRHIWQRVFQNILCCPYKHCWGVVKRLRHWILIPACEGSNPSSPARQKRVSLLTRFLFHRNKNIETPLFVSDVAGIMPGLVQAEGSIVFSERKLNIKSGENMAAYDSLMVFTGNANPELAQRVVRHLDISLGNASVSKFSDGEVAVELLENVRGRDVFILQPTCAPTNDNLMEILTMADALKRASAGRITTAIPYFGYARQDRRPRSVRVPISAKLVANMLYSAGIDRVLTVDLHADQIQGFFDIPVDNIYATPILLNDIKQQRIENLTVVSPDIGGVVRARAVAKSLNADLAIIDKRRPKANVAEVMNIIGDIQGKTCLIVDDMIDTANTLCKAAVALKERGAERVLAYASHAVFSGEAVSRIASSEIDQVVVTDTIPLSEAAKNCDRIRQVTIAGLLAETVRRISNEESVSYLFNEEVMTGSMLLP